MKGSFPKTDVSILIIFSREYQSIWVWVVLIRYLKMFSFSEIFFFFSLCTQGNTNQMDVGLFILRMMLVHGMAQLCKTHPVRVASVLHTISEHTVLAS